MLLKYYGLESFDRSVYDKLDEFALLACQDYNLGNKGDWFGNFREGLYAVYSRVCGVNCLFKELCSWEPPALKGEPKFVEYHLASIFFNIDSSIECLIFALNSLGYAVAPDLFLDIGDEVELRLISPINILKDVNRQRINKKTTEGYYKYFPSVKLLWNANKDLVKSVMDIHDVSKHRRVIFEGARQRKDDPPPSYFEALLNGGYKDLGIENDLMREYYVTPMEGFHFKSQPKKPIQQKEDPKDRIILEDIIQRFFKLINAFGEKALQDAESNIKLNYDHFINE